MYEIVHREQLSDTAFLWDVLAPDVAASAQAGHFIILRLKDGGERIPLTVADFDREKGTITLVIQALGKTTAQMMRGYQEGDSFLDFAGPLGLASVIHQQDHVVLVGGGLGVAPIFPQLRAFKEAGCRTTAIIGFRSKDLVFWEDRFRPFCDELIVCTDDGSYGRPGFVTVALEELLERERPNEVVAVGPLPMMRACAEVSRPFGVHTTVSLNAIMVDGTGMCGSCRVTVDGKIRFACVDGPEFDAHKVDFEELIVRQRRFTSEEQKATEAFDHVCNLEQQLFEEGKRNYKKIKELAPEQVPMPERNAGERAANFKEVNLGYGMQDAIEEAERCIQCKRPTCIAGCPVSIDIPRFIRHLLVRDLEGALEVIHESNLFPSICGRVCPQEAQCEAQCVIGRKVESVAIGRLERFVGDHARPPRVTPPANAGELGRVAIVGSGPGGLACAADLAKAGADVTIYEALHVAGGVLSYGIPPFRLPRDIVNRELKQLRDLGVKIETNKVVGKTFTIHQLLDERAFDAVFVATGAGYPKFLGIAGENAGMVYSANEFLTRVNLMGGDRFPFEDTPVNLGKSVIVLGAGNTAMDCLRVAKRLGAETVRCVYRRSEAEAPARLEELRHAKEEGIEFHFLHAPLAIETDANKEVVALTCQKMELGEPDASGRRKPVAIEGATETFACDMVIYALGTQANPIIAQTTPGLETHWGDYIVADPQSQATNIPGLFAGGDIVTGGATVILALGAGRRAAAAMRQWLTEKTWPPVLEQPEAEDTPKRPAREKVAATPAIIAQATHPLDEGDLSCANAPIRWQCKSCLKVYKGFAFPYGMCAACGGTLALEYAADVSSSDAQEAVRRAIEIELGGMSFYLRGAKECADEGLRGFFEKLAEMEAEHNQELRERYQVVAPDVDPAAISLSQIAIYADFAPENITDGIALLRLAIKLEVRARDFFAEQKSKFSEGTSPWKLYGELEAEEQEHVDLIRTELARFNAGKPGLL